MFSRRDLVFIRQGVKPECQPVWQSDGWTIFVKWTCVKWIWNVQIQTLARVRSHVTVRTSSKTWATHIRLPDTLNQLLPYNQLSETPFHANTGSEISKTTGLSLSLSHFKVRNTEQNIDCIRNKTASDNKYGKRCLHLAVYSVDSMPLLCVVMVPVWGQRDHLLVYTGFLSVQTLFSKEVFATFHAL